MIPPGTTQSDFDIGLSRRSGAAPWWVGTELSIGWVDTWVGLDWVELGRDFSLFGGLGWVHYSKSTKILKGL